MGWSIGFDSNWNRDIGYGVPAYCDHPGCKVEIDRGIAHVCGGEPYGGEEGCGLHFCQNHLIGHKCGRCNKGRPPYAPSADHPTWLRWKLEDESWAEWREQNPDAVEAMKVTIAAQDGEAMK